MRFVIIVALLLQGGSLWAKNAILADLAPNTWLRVDGGGGPPGGYLAYSGMAYDSNAAMMVLHGGGHSSDAGNAVWGFDINTLSWTILRASDGLIDDLSVTNLNTAYPCAVFVPAGESIGSAAPISRHTYDTVEYMDSVEEVFVAGTYTETNSSWYPFRCADAWTFSLATGAWTYRTAGPVGGEAAAAYDIISGLLFIEEQERTATYDPVDDKWEQLATQGAPPSSIETVLAIDTSRRELYEFGGASLDHNELWRFSIADTSWTKLTPTGTPPPARGGYGLLYDAFADALLVYQEKLWIYDIPGNRWLDAPEAGEVPPIRGGDSKNYVHGNFKFDPVHGVALLAVSNQGTKWKTGMYAYKYVKAGMDTLAPAPPTALSIE